MRPCVIQISGKQLLIAAISVFVSLAVTASVSIFYTNSVDRQSNQAWCDIINGLHTRYEKLPPNADPYAKQFAAQIVVLKQRYAC
jgi:hypothetical protein